MAVPERKGHRRTIAAAGVLGVLMLAAIWAATVSPLFRMQDVTVSGLDHFTRAQVLRMAQVSSTTNVLWLATGRVEARIESDPWVADAQVTKDLPSTLSIEVSERRPVLATGAEHSWELVAADGTVLEDSVKVRPDLPQASVPTVPVGDPIPTASLPLARMAGYLYRAGVLDSIGTVAFDPEGQMRIVLADGGRVTVGPPEELADKAEAIAGIVVWAEENHSKIRSIDVTAPSAPAAKVSRGTPPVEG